MIKWCLHLRHLSSGCYESHRKSGCLSLPSQRTLRHYTHFATAESGFSTAVDEQLIEAVRISTCPEWKKCVVVLMDEMHIREDVIYNKFSGASHTYVYMYIQWMPIIHIIGELGWIRWVKGYERSPCWLWGQVGERHYSCQAHGQVNASSNSERAQQWAAVPMHTVSLCFTSWRRNVPHSLESCWWFAVMWIPCDGADIWWSSSQPTDVPATHS